jgi:hypothetical protein
MNFKDEVSGDKQISVTSKCLGTLRNRKLLHAKQAIARVAQPRHNKTAFV